LLRLVPNAVSLNNEEISMPVIHAILHPTDLSENAKPAFHLACALARDYGAELRVLHVYPPPVNAAEAVDRRRPNGIAEGLLEQLRELTCEDRNISIDYRVEEGDPANVILDAARTSDLIVMGTHGRRGLRRALVGSVAEKVLREARCPVLTVRPSARLPEDRPAAAPGAGDELPDVELGSGD
jgi:nucleotide-binding universal stress UspA family protein